MTQATYKTTVVVWSAIGHTPITKRAGCYCDELVRTEIECADPKAAKEAVQKLIADTQHAVYGHFSIPEFPNHNTRNNFVSA